MKCFAFENLHPEIELFRLHAHPIAVWNCIDVLNLLFFLVAGFLQFQAVMLLRSMSADPDTVSTPKLLATGDFTDSYTMINSVNALVVRKFLQAFSSNVTTSSICVSPEIHVYYSILISCERCGSRYSSTYLSPNG